MKTATEFKPRHTLLVILTYLTIIFACAAFFSSCSTQRGGCNMSRGFVGTH